MSGYTPAPLVPKGSKTGTTQKASGSKLSLLEVLHVTHYRKHKGLRYKRSRMLLVAHQRLMS